MVMTGSNLFRRHKEQGIESVLYDNQGLTLIPGGVSIPAGARAIRAGDFVARVSAGSSSPSSYAKKYIVAKYTQAAATAGAAATSVVVNDAHAFEVGDLVDLGSDLNNVISSINYSTNTITFAAAIGTAVSVNDEVFVSEDRKRNAIGIALLPSVDKDAVRLGYGSAYVTPREGDVLQGAIALTGRFYVSKLKNLGIDDLTATSPTHDFVEAFPGRRVISAGGSGENILVLPQPSSHLSFTD